MKKGLVVLSFALLAGCSLPVPASKSQAKDIVDGIQYIQDGRTGICFAMLGTSGDTGFVKVSITSVECSEKVLAEVAKLK